METTYLAIKLADEGIRQTELAEASGISLGTINRVCKGKQKVSTTTQAKLIRGIYKLTGKKFEKEDIFK